MSLLSKSRYSRMSSRISVISKRKSKNQLKGNSDNISEMRGIMNQNTVNIDQLIPKTDLHESDIKTLTQKIDDIVNVYRGFENSVSR